MRVFLYRLGDLEKEVVIVHPHMNLLGCEPGRTHDVDTFLYPRGLQERFPHVSATHTPLYVCHHGKATPRYQFRNGAARAVVRRMLD
jgi:hypothetical protein